VIQNWARHKIGIGNASVCPLYGARTRASLTTNKWGIDGSVLILTNKNYLIEIEKGQYDLAVPAFIFLSGVKLSG
jgi:hypothetical protein